MKVGIVVHRFADGIGGGAERHAMAWADRLATSWDVTVFTTCALDYHTWEDHFPAGEARLRNFQVARFPVARTRDFAAFARTSAQREKSAYTLSSDEEERYFCEQGPYSPALVEALRKRAPEFDAFIFFTYLYYTTVAGIGAVGGKAFLVPTAHDEPPFYFGRTLSRVFAEAAGFLCSTAAEVRLIRSVYEIPAGTPSTLCGAGVEDVLDLSAATVNKVRAKFAPFMDRPYFLYLGRVTVTKGCGELIAAFRRFREEHGAKARLLLVGPSDLGDIRDDAVATLGYVDEEEKEVLLRDARALVHPSRLESLSIVMLEAWQHGLPVICNGECEVMRDHCETSQGGLYYYTPTVLRGLLAWAATHPEECRALGQVGQAYVRQAYSWDNVIGRVRETVELWCQDPARTAFPYQPRSSSSEQTIAAASTTTATTTAPLGDDLFERHPAAVHAARLGKEPRSDQRG